MSGGGITLSGLGNVILGIFNGQKHLPHRDSKVTQVLRECLGSLTCQVRTVGPSLVLWGEVKTNGRLKSAKSLNANS